LAARLTDLTQTVLPPGVALFDDDEQVVTPEQATHRVLAAEKDAPRMK